MERFRVESLEQRRLLDAQVEVGGFVGPSGDDVPMDVYTYLDVTPSAQYVAKDGKSLSGSLGSFKGDLAADGYRATIEWGDGNSSDGIVVANADGSLSIVGAHDYADNGQYGVSVVIDGTDGSVGYSYETALMGADRLTLLGSPSVWAEPSTEFTQQYLGSFFDSAADGATAYSVTINWGDGTTSAGTASQGYGGAWDVYGDHAYAAEGSFNISLTVASGNDSLQADGTAEIATHDYVDMGCIDPIDGINIKPFYRGGVMYSMTGGEVLEKGPETDTPAVEVAVDPTVNPATESPVEMTDPTTGETVVVTTEARACVYHPTADTVAAEIAKVDAPLTAPVTAPVVTHASAPATTIFSNRSVGQQQKSLFEDATAN